MDTTVDKSLFELQLVRRRDTPSPLRLTCVSLTGFGGVYSGVPWFQRRWPTPSGIPVWQQPRVHAALLGPLSDVYQHRRRGRAEHASRGASSLGCRGESAVAVVPGEPGSALCLGSGEGFVAGYSQVYP